MQYITGLSTSVSRSGSRAIRFRIYGSAGSFQRPTFFIQCHQNHIYCNMTTAHIHCVFIEHCTRVWYPFFRIKGTSKPSKINTVTESHLIWLVWTRTNIILRLSSLEYCHDQFIKTTGKNKNLYRWIQLPMLYVARYNELEQLYMYMPVLLHCHLVAF